MSAKKSIAIQNFIDYLKSSQFQNYLEYINNAAPMFAKVMQDFLQNEFLSIQTSNCDDVYKYLFDPIYEYSKNSGKLHRPLTCIISYLACSNQNFDFLEPVFAVASALEYFQTAALIHDDIADEATLRRSKPCMHITQGQGIAINAGDYGLSITVGSVVHNLHKFGIDEHKIIQIVDKLISMQYLTIEGQAMDLGWARDKRFDITADDYFNMATKKSAYYSASIPCVLGALMADCDDNTIDALDSFGLKIGLAFQIRDDILNLVHKDNTKDQKDFMSDIVEGKRTLCVVKALELADNASANRLKEILLLKTTDSKILCEAVDIMQNCGAIDFVSSMADDLCDEAQLIIKDLKLNSKWKDLLIDMASWVKNRKI